jgi:serine/threonine protein kinase
MPSNESIKDYNVFEQLGQGGFAQVYRAQVKETSKEVAIKMVNFFHTLKKFYLLIKKINIKDR